MFARHWVLCGLCTSRWHDNQRCSVQAHTFEGPGRCTTAHAQRRRCTRGESRPHVVAPIASPARVMVASPARLGIQIWGHCDILFHGSLLLGIRERRERNIRHPKYLKIVASHWLAGTSAYLGTFWIKFPHLGSILNINQRDDAFLASDLQYHTLHSTLQQQFSGFAFNKFYRYTAGNNKGIWHPLVIKVPEAHALIRVKTSTLVTVQDLVDFG